MTRWRFIEDRLFGLQVFRDKSYTPCVSTGNEIMISHSLLLSGSKEETRLLQNPPRESRQSLLTSFVQVPQALERVPSRLQSIKKTQLFLELNASAASWSSIEGSVCTLLKYKSKTEKLDTVISLISVSQFDLQRHYVSERGACFKPDKLKKRNSLL